MTIGARRMIEPLPALCGSVRGSGALLRAVCHTLPTMLTSSLSRSACASQCRPVPSAAGGKGDEPMPEETMDERVTNLEKLAETLAPLPQEMKALTGRVVEVEGRLGTVESQIVQLRTDTNDGFSAIRGEMSDMEGRLRGDMSTVKTELRGDMGTMKTQLRDDMATMKTELRGEMATMKTELRGEMATMKTELRGEMATMKSELRGDMTTMKTELREDIAELGRETADRFLRLGNDMRTLFEEHVGRRKVIAEGNPARDPTPGA